MFVICVFSRNQQKINSTKKFLSAKHVKTGKPPSELAHDLCQRGGVHSSLLYLNDICRDQSCVWENRQWDSRATQLNKMSLKRSKKKIRHTDEEWVAFEGRWGACARPTKCPCRQKEFARGGVVVQRKTKIGFKLFSSPGLRIDEALLQKGFFCEKRNQQSLPSEKMTVTEKLSLPTRRYNFGLNPNTFGFIKNINGGLMGSWVVWVSGEN